MFICLNTHAHTHTHIYIYVYVYTHIYVYKFHLVEPLFVDIARLPNCHRRLSLSLYIYTYVYMFEYTRTQIHTHTHMRKYTHTHIYIHFTWSSPFLSTLHVCQTAIADCRCLAATVFSLIIRTEVIPVG